MNRNRKDDARKRRIAALVMTLLEEILRPDEAPANDARPDEYTSKDLPPDIRTAGHFNTVAATIPEARKQGRVWIVPRAAWEAARAKKPRKAPVAVTSDIELADAALEAAGLRKTKRGSY